MENIFHFAGLNGKQLVLLNKNKKIVENFINQLHNGDCIEVMKKMPDNSVDLVSRELMNPFLNHVG